MLNHLSAEDPATEIVNLKAERELAVADFAPAETIASFDAALAAAEQALSGPHT